LEYAKTREIVPRKRDRFVPARLEQEQKSEDARTKAMKKELEWARQNPKGRQAKSKARLARFEELSDYDIPEAQ